MRMRPKTAIALTATAGGLAMTACAGVYLMDYNPWDAPQDLTDGIRCLGVALVLFIVPAAMIITWFARELCRQARQMNLNSWQAALVEFAVMEAVHHEWSKANAEWSQRLTDSVMGPAERKW